MKTILKWINLVIPFVIAVLFCIVVFELFKMDLNTTKEFIAILLSFLIALVSINYHYISISKIEYKTFTECNRRFDDLNEILNEIIRLKKNDKKEYHLNKRIGDIGKNKTAEQHILDYLDLCAEEFYLYKYSGIVSRRVWKHWFNGIKYYFMDENKDDNIFTFILDRELGKNGKGNDSYYGFLDFLKKELIKLKDK